jgi:hypothetical protein
LDGDIVSGALGMALAVLSLSDGFVFAFGLLAERDFAFVVWVP